MTGIGYSSAGLRAGAQEQQAAGAEVGNVASVLASAVAPAAVFGHVRSAAGFAAAVEVAREGQGRAATAEAVARAVLAERTRAAAAQSEELTATSTATARSVGPFPLVPGSIVAALTG